MTTTMHHDDYVALSFLERHGVHPDRRDFTGVVFARGGNIIAAAGIDAMASGINAFLARHDATIHAAGKGWTKLMLKPFFQWVFGGLGFVRLTSEIRASNIPSIRMTEAVGFVREGEKRGAAPDGGNIIIFGCLASECKFGG
jgi:RimJ/RimL family protein N-acetyltransferase